MLLVEQENARSISRTRASFDITNCILSFLSPAGEPGVWQTAQVVRQRRVPSRYPRPRLPVRTLRPRLRRLPRLTFLRRREAMLSHLRSQTDVKQILDNSLD